MDSENNEVSKLKKKIESLESRLKLLARINVGDANEENGIHIKLKESLDKISKIIDTTLPNLAKEYCPNDFPKILRDMQYRFEEFSYFCAYPELGQKIIVGIGGSFSAGKSSFINRLIGDALLAASINPTTSIPTYLYYGEEEKLIALNIFKKSICLSKEEFKTFTHKEEKKYHTNMGKMLQKMKIQTPKFKWRNLAILDTPGHSKAINSNTFHSDLEIAKQQLKSVDYLIWLISAEKGTITEEDIKFLSELKTDIPRLILINKADKKNIYEIENIVKLVKETAIARNLNVMDVIPVCSHLDNYDYPIDHILQYFADWNQSARQVDFMYYFKKPFHQYSSYIVREKKKLKEYITLLNNIAWKIDGQYADHANELKEKFKYEVRILEKVAIELKTIEDQFFQEIQKISILLQVPFFEPHYFELAEPESCGKLLLVLENMLKAKGKNYTRSWDGMYGAMNKGRINHILNKLPMHNYSEFQQL